MDFFQIYVWKNPIIEWPPPQVLLSCSSKDLAPPELEPSPSLHSFLCVVFQQILKLLEIIC